jgi:hypothetical protein
MIETIAEPKDRPALTPNERRAFARLRSLLANASEVSIATDDDGSRWLSDRYAIINVTNDSACEGVADGQYKLTAGKGFVPDDLVPPNALALLEIIEGEEANWLPVTRTEWSVADSEAKTLLCYATMIAEPATTAATSKRHPVAINEGIWNAFVAAFDNKDHTRVIRFEKDPDKPTRPFRIIVDNKIVAYSMGIRLPDGAEKIAKLIVEAS